MREPSLLEATGKQEIKANRTSLQFESKPYVVVNATVYFNGQCEECRPNCGAICCRAWDRGPNRRGGQKWTVCLQGGVRSV
jgi:hypothetical protein